MKLAPAETSTCASCGAPSEETLNGGVGCMVCLLRVGLSDAADKVDEQFEDPDSDHFGPYIIDRREDGSVFELGRGAMGVTYRALDTALRRAVALKIIKTDLAGRSAEARERFMREARAAAALRHPNVATVYHFGIREETGQCFYAMELIEGETLHARVRRTGPLDVQTTVEIAQQIAAALGAAEKRGLVHRDLKPVNVMIAALDDESAESGASVPLAHQIDATETVTPHSDHFTVKVIDFGVAKALTEETDPRVLTHNGFVGTPAFASPEQFANAPVDVRSDVYSLGATLWYLLTGKIPFADRARETRAPVEQLTAARVPSSLISLLRRMLAAEPAARPSVRELLARLTEIHARISDRGKRWRGLATATALFTISAATVFFIIRASHTTPNATSEVQPKSIPRFQKLLDSPPAQNVETTSDSLGASIAVLPFESIGDEKENAFLATGIHDDLLANLSRLGQLKVISRNSVLPFKSAPRNLRQIGNALGVRTVLEGSVRRAGNRARINVQLIDATNDAQIWADSFDREMTDLFSVQSDLAVRIATALQVKLSPAERAAIETPPTRDAEAYDFYLRGQELLHGIAGLGKRDENLSTAIALLNRAVARDPNFALGYCLLAELHLARFRVSRTENVLSSHDPVGLGKVRSNLEIALRLAPDLGEAHLVRGMYFYRTNSDYGTASAEFSIARRALPNNGECFHLSGLLERRLGGWSEGLHYQIKAVSLDPQNATAREDLASTYYLNRNFAEAERVLDRAIVAIPEHGNFFRLKKAQVGLMKGDLEGCRAALQSLPPDYEYDGLVGYYRALLALYLRDFAEADRILVETLERLGPKKTEWWVVRDRAIVARAEGDRAKVEVAFQTALRVESEMRKKTPDDPGVLSMIALFQAGLGRKEGASREIGKAVESRPIAADALDGPAVARTQALVYAWCGERDRALEELAMLVKIPSGPDPGDLRFNPAWDVLRGDPRFNQIVAAAAEPLKFE